MSTKQGPKGYIGIGLSGPIAKWYAASTKKSLKDYRDASVRISQQVSSGCRVLEIAPGPGYVAIELSRLGSYSITGVDISESFVQIATENARAAGAAVKFLQGDASNLPLESDSFDFIYCRAAFKNFRYPVKALEEMHRVLRVGGIAWIEDLRPDITEGEIADTVRTMGLSSVEALLTRWIFKHMLARRAHSQEQLQQLVAATSFKTCHIRTESIGYQVVLRKHPPAPLQG